MANVFGGMIAVSLEGTVLCEIKCARLTLHQVWFQMLDEFPMQGMCEVLVESIGTPFIGDGCIRRIMCGLVMLI